MTQSFDYDAFIHQSLSIIAQSADKTFFRLAAEIEALRQRYTAVVDTSARKYILRDLNRRLLMVAMDTSQPRAVVDRLYQRSVRQGFNELDSEVASAIEYADYCCEQCNPEIGLRALKKLRKKLHKNNMISPGFFQVIEKSISRVENT